MLEKQHHREQLTKAAGKQEGEARQWVGARMTRSQAAKLSAQTDHQVV